MWVIILTSLLILSGLAALFTWLWVWVDWYTIDRNPPRWLKNDE